MSKYIDGFLFPVPTANLEDYKHIATLASQVWKDHGALEYVEAVGDDYPVVIEGGKPAPEMIGAAKEDCLIFSYIVYESREHRDAVNAKVMDDPRMKEICPEMNSEVTPPFDPRRMIFGGFQVMVQA